MVLAMMARLEEERRRVKAMIKEEVEKLMRMGADITDMMYHCVSSNSDKPCITPRTMRLSYGQDGSQKNIMRMLWMFHELPVAVHQDCLMKRRTHQDLVCARIERRMNMRWGPKKEGESVLHKNCLHHMYSRVLNEKKQTITKRGEGNNHGIMPYVRVPKSRKASKNASNYKKGKTLFYWKLKGEEEHLVSECCK